jgi:hypothetical protein
LALRRFLLVAVGLARELIASDAPAHQRCYRLSASVVLGWEAGWGKIMYRVGVVRLPLAAVAVLFLYGCTSVEMADTQFKRRSTSLAALKSDSDQCWKLAQKTNISSEDATGGMVMGYALFGLVGAAVVASSNEEARKDPKNYHRRKVHDECMTQRGYKKVE